MLTTYLHGSPSKAFCPKVPQEMSLRPTVIGLSVEGKRSKGDSTPC